jgi:hypothetical protein
MRFATKLFSALAVTGTLAAASANAAPVTVADNYWGGNDHGYGDSIGGGVFNVSSAVISRTNANTLQIVINTPYAGHAGEAGTGYGSLFITPGVNVWSPIGTAANHWVTDHYQAGDWTYAFDMPGNPGSATSGTGRLYAVQESRIVMAHGSNPGETFRDGQAVQYDSRYQQSLRDGTWVIGNGTITFNIVDNGLLGNSFAFSWAMDCGNDVIQGQVNAVPEASTWAMMMLGFVGVAGFGYRRRFAKPQLSRSSV